MITTAAAIPIAIQGVERRSLPYAGLPDPSAISPAAASRSFPRAIRAALAIRSSAASSFGAPAMKVSSRTRSSNGSGSPAGIEFVVNSPSMGLVRKERSMHSMTIPVMMPKSEPVIESERCAVLGRNLHGEPLGP